MSKEMSLLDYKKEYPIKDLDSLNPEERKKVYDTGKRIGMEMVGWYDTVYYFYDGVVYESNYYVGD